MVSPQASPPTGPHPPVDSNLRKRGRVGKACDRCRIKKAKCDGLRPCGRCNVDNAICAFSERKKSLDRTYPKGYVEVLEEQQAQLVVGLRGLYGRLVNDEGWIGPRLEESSAGVPLTHDILERLGASRQYVNGTVDPFGEDLLIVQQRLIASGAGFVRHQEAPDDSPESSYFPMSESLPQNAPLLTEPFARNDRSLTPLNNSAFPQTLWTSAPIEAHTYAQAPPLPSTLNPALLQYQSWVQPATRYNENMDFIKRDECLTDSASMSPLFGGVSLSMDASLAMIDWNNDDEDGFKTFFNPVTVG